MTIAANPRKAVTGAASPHLRTGHAIDAAEGGVDLSFNPGDFVAVLGPRVSIRGRRLAFVFRSYNPLPRATALENVASPMAYAGVPESRRTRIALQAMELAGVAHLAASQPHVLTGEQQQRVAIARCLVNDPGLILADEPVAALDANGGESVMRLLARLNAERGITILLATQRPEIAAYARRVVTVRGDRVVADQDEAPPIPYRAL